MKIICLDLEGVLVPEMWIAFADAAGIPALRRTTRDEPDYDKLMKGRIAILKEHGLGLAEIQRVIATVDPMEGARAFLDALREETQVLILSDTFTQFALLQRARRRAGRGDHGLPPPLRADEALDGEGAPVGRL